MSDPTTAILKTKKDIFNLLDHLKELVELNKSNGWGDLAELNHIREQLVNCVAFYGGLTERQIRNVLSEDV